MSLMKLYWMLQNAKITAVTIFELLNENQKGVKKNYYYHPDIRVNDQCSLSYRNKPVDLLCKSSD